MKETALKTLYNTVLSQTISASGKHVFVGNRYGDIFIQEIEEYHSTDSAPRKTFKIFSHGTLPINSLAFHREFLIVGTVSLISGHKWNESKCELSAPSWELKIPVLPEPIESADVNCLWINADTDELYAGCGDNLMYLISLEEGKFIRNFIGHKDYIHCVAGSEGKMFTASEDGSVLSWSPNQKNPVSKIEPYKNDTLVRPEFGKWQGTVSVANDWLICGGGPKLSLWHLRSLECTKGFPFPGKIHCSDFLDDLIIVAGECPTAQHYSFNGDLVADLPVEHTAVYSIVWQKEPCKFMSIGGSSNKLQIMTDFRYMDTSVDLYQ